MNENISRSTIFRNKMRIEAAKRKEEEKSKIKISQCFYAVRRTSSPKSKEDIEK